MYTRALCATLILVLAGPSLLFAQRSGSGKGRFATQILSSDVTELPDGRTVQVSHYHQATFAEDPNHPLDNQKADCVGLFVSSEDGTPIAASGSCYGRDAAGDGVSYWWRRDKVGTADCPNGCGSFGLYAGFGKYSGITGNGTWRVDPAFPDGNMGTWESSYSLKR